jgi:methylenetetrahydrofolate reductase (NADPH)
VTRPPGRLAALLARGGFAVTGEIVPPKGASGDPVSDHARGLVGYVDAVNLTDNPLASAHMSPLAGVRFVADAGIEPTVQLTVRDRNRLGLTADLLGAWALGARNVFCLSGDPVAVGDHPDAAVLADPPHYLIGVADVPFAEPYDPSKLESKLDAGADFVTTQIVYDAERLAAWADAMRPRGLFERAKVIIGITPLRSAKQARFMDERLPGVRVPSPTIAALEAAGEDAGAVGMDLTVALVEVVQTIPDIAGIHIMAMGHDAVTRDLVERTGLFPRPTV